MSLIEEAFVTTQEAVAGTTLGEIISGFSELNDAVTVKCHPFTKNELDMEHIALRDSLLSKGVATAATVDTILGIPIVTDDQVPMGTFEVVSTA